MRTVQSVDLLVTSISKAGAADIKQRTEILRLVSLDQLDIVAFLNTFSDAVAKNLAEQLFLNALQVIDGVTPEKLLKLDVKIRPTIACIAEAYKQRPYDNFNAIVDTLLDDRRGFFTTTQTEHQASLIYDLFMTAVSCGSFFESAKKILEKFRTAIALEFILEAILLTCAYGEMRTFNNNLLDLLIASLDLYGADQILSAADKMPTEYALSVVGFLNTWLSDKCIDIASETNQRLTNIFSPKCDIFKELVKARMLAALRRIYDTYPMSGPHKNYLLYISVTMSRSTFLGEPMLKELRRIINQYPALGTGRAFVALSSLCNHIEKNTLLSASIRDFTIVASPSVVSRLSSAVFGDKRHGKVQPTFGMTELNSVTLRTSN